MKMKEVCRKTGLTERAVRYYIERELIQPIATTSVVSNRTDYQFNDSHISKLRDISILRSYGFSIDVILKMQRDPARISMFVEERSEEIEAQKAVFSQRQQVFQRLIMGGFDSISDLTQLAERLRREQCTISLPDQDVRLDFRQFDREEGAEASPALEQSDIASVEREMRKQDGRKKLLLVVVSFLLAAALGIGLLAREWNRSLYSNICISSVSFSDKWAEDGLYYAKMTFWDTATPFPVGETYTVQIEDYILYKAIVSGYPYLSAVLTVKINMRKGIRDGLITGAAAPEKWNFDGAMLDLGRVLRDERLSEQYIVVSTIQGDDAG